MLERTVYRDQYQSKAVMKKKLEFEERKQKAERQEKIRGLGANRGGNRGGYRGRY
jgi:hypothetical protein